MVRKFDTRVDDFIELMLVVPAIFKNFDFDACRRIPECKRALESGLLSTYVFMSRNAMFLSICIIGLIALATVGAVLAVVGALLDFWGLWIVGMGTVLGVLVSYLDLRRIVHETRLEDANRAKLLWSDSIKELIDIGHRYRLFIHESLACVS